MRALIAVIPIPGSVIPEVDEIPSFFWGGGTDIGRGIAVDAGGIYVTGSTYSLDFPTENPFQPNLAGHPDVFVTKISPSNSGPARRSPAAYEPALSFSESQRP